MLVICLVFVFCGLVVYCCFDVICWCGICVIFWFAFRCGDCGLVILLFSVWMLVCLMLTGVVGLFVVSYSTLFVNSVVWLVFVVWLW